MNVYTLVSGDEISRFCFLTRELAMLMQGELNTIRDKETERTGRAGLPWLIHLMLVIEPTISADDLDAKDDDVSHPLRITFYCERCKRRVDGQHVEASPYVKCNTCEAQYGIDRPGLGVM